MSKAFFIRAIYGLQPDPSDDRARELLASVPLGSIVQVDITRPRNIARHRFFWAMATHIANAIPGNLTAENLVDILKIETGHVKIVQGARDTYRLPKSIAFHNMDEAEFAAFVNRCCMFICETWVPTIAPSLLRTQIESLLGIGSEVR